jgi:hypothetical protein
MVRFVAAAALVMCLGIAGRSASANDGAVYPGAVNYQAPPVHSTHGPTQYVDHGAPGVAGVQTYNAGRYPVLNAPLYPCPVQYTPSWNGGTIITNQALAPHEMLYPHRYHAMYPPFYYKVKGCWIWTPFGMRQHEHWELQGTEVKVNYRSRISWLSGFHPPRIR